MTYLIFDFDGVLGDTQHQVINHLVRNGDCNTREEALVHNIAHFSRKPPITRDSKPTPEKLQKDTEWIRGNGQHIANEGCKLFEAFIENVKSLPETCCAVVSTGSELYVRDACIATGIPFTHILAFEDHHSKEEKVELICKDWDIKPAEAYYVTDSLADVYELSELMGVDRMIGCSWGFVGYDILCTVLPPSQVMREQTDVIPVQ